MKVKPEPRQHGGWPGTGIFGKLSITALSAPASASTAAPAPISADAGAGRLGRDPGPGPAPGQVPPAGAPLRRGEEPSSEEKAITAIAHTLLKIAYQVLKSGQPYQDLGADFYTTTTTLPPSFSAQIRSPKSENPQVSALRSPRNHTQVREPAGQRVALASKP